MSAHISINDLVLPRISSPLVPLTLDIPPGAMIAVVGRNGCGKSTLLSVLAGLLSPRGGSVAYGGQRADRMSIAERAAHLAWVQSTPPRGSALTVEAVLELASHFGSTENAEQNVVERTIEDFGLAQYACTPLNRLSDGWAQRAMIARAFAQNTPTVLLDEPTAFLDLPAKLLVFKAFAKAQERGRSIVLSSHDFDALDRLAYVQATLQFTPSEIACTSSFNVAGVEAGLLG
jgi:iron complex transport system ATP-binding protein